MVNGWAILAIMPGPLLTFAAVDLLLIAISIPLLRRRVPPNMLYGLRVPATFADEWVWYEANARTARDTIALGVVHLLLTFVLMSLEALTESVAVGVSVSLLVAGVLAVAIVGWRRANRLLASRRG